MQCEFCHRQGSTLALIAVHLVTLSPCGARIDRGRYSVLPDATVVSERGQCVVNTHI